METIVVYAQELVYSLLCLMPSAYQKASLNALFGLFLQAQGHPLPQHTQLKSPSSLSRFLNHYQWSTRGVIRATRHWVMQQVCKQLPMVDPVDIGKIAARFMVEPVETTGLHYVEGLDHYSSEDVAIAFATTLGKPVKAVEVSKAQWIEALESVGFSEKVSATFANMTDATIRSPEFPAPEIPVRGETSLQAHVARLVEEFGEGD